MARLSLTQPAQVRRQRRLLLKFSKTCLLRATKRSPSRLTRFRLAVQRPLPRTHRLLRLTSLMMTPLAWSRSMPSTSLPAKVQRTLPSNPFLMVGSKFDSAIQVQPVSWLTTQLSYQVLRRAHQTRPRALISQPCQDLLSFSQTRRRLLSTSTPLMILTLRILSES